MSVPRTLALVFSLCLVGAVSAQEPFTLVEQTHVAVEPMIDWPTDPCDRGLGPRLDIALFDLNNMPQFQSLTSVSVTLTIEDGDTAVGEFDHGNLGLLWNDQDLGMKLDGFRGGFEDTLTFTLSADEPDWNSALMADLLDSMQTTGGLLLTITDATPFDNCINCYSSNDVITRITGFIAEPIPEPAALLVWGLALAGLIGWRRRQTARPCIVRASQPG